MERDVLVVAVGRRRFAFLTAQVRGIDFRPTLTPVPLVPPFLLGISHLRGTLQPVADLAALLDLPDPRGKGRYVVSVVAGDLAAGLVVDEVETVARWPHPLGEAMPRADPTLPAIAIGQVSDASGEMILVDVERLLAGVADALAEQLAGRGIGGLAWGLTLGPDTVPSPGRTGAPEGTE